MDHFDYRDGRLWAEGVDLATLAEEHGTPAYVYSRATLERHWKAFDAAFGKRRHLVCYAVKANSNLAVLNLLARLGSGFDIVSGGELERVLRAGGDPGKVVFSGVGKQPAEMRRALEVGIRCFNVESAPELERPATGGRRAGRAGPRVPAREPDVDAGTHPYISTGLKENKFGIPVEEAPAVYRARPRAAQHPHHRAGLPHRLPAHRDPALRRRPGAGAAPGPGTGKGRHQAGAPGPGRRPGRALPRRDAAAAGGIPAAAAGGPGRLPYEILIEPGRAIVANAGVLLTRVTYLKCGGHKNFAIVDAAMNDLLRPPSTAPGRRSCPVIPRASGTSAPMTWWARCARPATSSARTAN
jgi:diaminopimelate decarboxylase